MTSFSAEALLERAGPIVMKEVRQGLRARVFAVFFTLLLVAALSVALVAMAIASDSPSASVGPGTFFAYLLVLGAVWYFIIPFQAFRSMVREREEETWVLLALTGLGGRHIVRGKYLNAMAQVVLFGSACAPFVLFSYYLNGVALVQLVLGLVTAFSFSSLLVSVAVFIGAEGKTRLGRTSAHFAVLGVLLASCMMAVGASGAFAFELFTRLAGKEFITFLWLTAAFCGVCAETSVLLLRHAAMALSLPSEREALAPRRELIGFTVLNLFVACLLLLGLDGDADIAAVVGIMQLLWLLPFALLAVSEHDGWSKAHASLGWQKPGALRSTLTVWALVAMTAIVLTASRFVLGGRHHVADTVLIVGAAYVVLFTAMAAFFGRTIRFTSVPVAVVTRLAFAISLLLGIGTSVFMMVLTQSSARHGLPLHVFNPPAVMLELVDRSDEHVGFTFFLAVLTGTAALVALGTLGHEDEERLA